MEFSLLSNFYWTRAVKAKSHWTELTDKEEFIQCYCNRGIEQTSTETNGGRISISWGELVEKY